jgi:outer membrane protein, heavy metal efflux system
VTRRTGGSLLGFVTVFAALLGGCTGAPRDAGFGDVRDAVARRAGLAPAWPAGDGSADAVSRRVTELFSRPLTAAGAVEIALLHNPGMQAELAGLGIARADLVQAGLLRNPIFNGEIRFPASPVQPFQISLAQSFLDLLRLPRRKRIAASLFEEVKLRLGAELVALVADTRAAFFTARASRENVALWKSVVEAGAAAADLAERQRKAGNITALERESQQALLEEARLEATRMELRFALDRERVNRLLGASRKETLWSDEETPEALPAREADREGLESLALVERLDVAASRAAVVTAARAVPGARLETLGDVAVDVHRERDAEGVATTGPGLEIPIPIFDQGQAASSRARAALLQAQKRFEALASDARSEVRSAHARVLAARRLLESTRDVLVPLRRRIVEETLLEYNGMLAGVFQLLSARQSEILARQLAIDALRDYWVARAELERAVGGPLVLAGKGEP